MYSGPADEGERVLAPLRKFGTPLVDMSSQMPFRVAQSMFDPFLPKRERLYYFKSADLKDFDDATIDATIEVAMSRPVPSILMAIWQYAGAMRRAPAGDTAFASRSTPFLFSIDAIWDDPKDTDRVIAWARENVASMKQYSSGGSYVNFAGFGEEGEAQVRATYGANYDKLVALKNKYDPQNLFRMNQNIRPTA
jgi:FAD/FMN-containing dehydrogenase